jgi:hypothetical protein
MKRISLFYVFSLGIVRNLAQSNLEPQAERIQDLPIRPLLSINTHTPTITPSPYRRCNILSSVQHISYRAHIAQLIPSLSIQRTQNRQGRRFPQLDSVVLALHHRSYQEPQS